MSRLPAPRLLMIALPLPLLLGGCAAKTAFDIATAPVRGARDAVNTGSKAVDLLTTSTGEADQKRGRKLRKAQNRMAKLERRYRDLSEDCADGDEGACEDRYEVWNEMEALRPYLPERRY